MDAKKSTLLVFMFVALVSMAGCHNTETSSWSVSVHTALEEENGNYTIPGFVAMEGKASGALVTGVCVQFLDAENETLDEIEIGTLHAKGSPDVREGMENRVRVNFTREFTVRPQYILVGYETIEAPPGSIGHMEGRVWKDYGENSGYARYLDYDPEEICNPTD